MTTINNQQPAINMVEVENLIKTYGAQNAVDDISFRADKGEIVGFLGPNGAGKSTTMKIALGYLPPTAGTVRIGGFDVRQAPLEVRRRVGYLPEHNPLYLDMYVHEYLEFIGSVHGLRGRELRQRVAQLVQKVGLTREQNKQLGALSKGYRQRVGLAEALVHDPDVLILDEPTTGLDPNQILRNTPAHPRSWARIKPLFSAPTFCPKSRRCAPACVIISRGQAGGRQRRWPS